MLSQIEKAINLAKKTGDRLIIFDHINTDRAMVVLGLNEYEQLLDNRPEPESLTEEQLLDRINRDIATWKDTNNSEDDDSEEEHFFSPKLAENKVFEETFAGAEDYPEAKQEKPRKQWSIPEEVKEGAEEIVEEDRTYLEEVTF